MWRVQKIQEWIQGDLLKGSSGDGEKELRNI